MVDCPGTQHSTLDALTMLTVQHFGIAYYHVKRNICKNISYRDEKIV